jgi:hypothetical protein
MAMRAMIVYESMFGNTHVIADAIGKGLETAGVVFVVPVSEAGREPLGDVDLLVVGGPTHFHGMSRTRTRKWAIAIARNPKSHLVLDPGAQGAGVRDWLGSLGQGHTNVAVFDTRRKGPAVLWGRASKGIGRTLRAHGFEMVSKPKSFFVTKDHHLKRGEEVRAEEWGQRLATRLVSNGAAKVDRPGQPPTSKET